MSSNLTAVHPVPLRGVSALMAPRRSRGGKLPITSRRLLVVPGVTLGQRGRHSPGSGAVVLCAGSRARWFTGESRGFQNGAGMVLQIGAALSAARGFIT